MAKYIFVEVSVPIEEGSEQHRKLLNLAEQMGVGLETAVRNVASLGIAHHIEGNIPLYERACAQK